MPAKKAAKKTPAKRAAKRPVAKKTVTRSAPATEAHAIMRGTRQSPYKMRLVIDQIRGKDVNEALALLTFSKKHAAKQITKTLKSAVANADGDFSRVVTVPGHVPGAWYAIAGKGATGSYERGWFNIKPNFAISPSSGPAGSISAVAPPTSRARLTRSRCLVPGAARSADQSP